VEEARSTTLKTDNGEKMQEKGTFGREVAGAVPEPDTLLPIPILRGDAQEHLLEGEKRLILERARGWIECS